MGPYRQLELMHEGHSDGWDGSLVWVIFVMCFLREDPG